MRTARRGLFMSSFGRRNEDWQVYGQCRRDNGRKFRRPAYPRKKEEAVKTVVSEIKRRYGENAIMKGGNHEKQ